MIIKKKNELYELKQERGKFLLYKNKEHIKTFYHQLIAMGYMQSIH